MRRIGLFAGTFDPITLGHLDVLRRSLGLFDRLIVAVADRHHKSTLFTAAERVEMIRESLAPTELSRVEVRCFEGLLVDFAREVGALAVVRGMRFVSDFEYELQMAQMNRKLYPEMETIFLSPAEQFGSLNSTLVKEIALHGGPVKGFVPPGVVRRLRAKRAELTRASADGGSRSSRSK
jgi:pantetheine-phosphate adenylyltransferase